MGHHSGETVGIRFDDAAWTVKGSAASALFVPESSLTKGGTCFTFLPDAWRRWPEHWFILVTDGDGSVLPSCLLTESTPARWSSPTASATRPVR